MNVDDPAMQRFLWRKRDGVKEEVELAPFFLDTLEHLLGLPFDIDIERHEDRRFQVLGERLDIFLRPLIQVGHRQFRPERAERLCATPGNRLVVGDADDQTSASLECYSGLGECRNIHDTLSLASADEDRLHGRQCVCAIINSSSVGKT